MKTLVYNNKYDEVLNQSPQKANNQFAVVEKVTKDKVYANGSIFKCREYLQDSFYHLRTGKHTQQYGYSTMHNPWNGTHLLFRHQSASRKTTLRYLEQLNVFVTEHLKLPSLELEEITNELGTKGMHMWLCSIPKAYLNNMINISIYSSLLRVLWHMEDGADTFESLMSRFAESSRSEGTPFRLLGTKIYETQNNMWDTFILPIFEIKEDMTDLKPSAYINAGSIHGATGIRTLWSKIKLMKESMPESTRLGIMTSFKESALYGLSPEVSKTLLKISRKVMQ